MSLPGASKGVVYCHIKQDVCSGISDDVHRVVPMVGYPLGINTDIPYLGGINYHFSLEVLTIFSILVKCFL